MMNKKNLLEPDLARLRETVAPGIVEAMVVASDQLKKIGVRHMLIGGLALGAYGYIRATKDVDFLLGDEGFDHHAYGLITAAKGVPSMVKSVRVDTLSLMPGEGDVEEALKGTVESAGIPVAPVEILIFLKLKSPRPRDESDIAELLIAGIDPMPVMVYLKEHAPALLPKFMHIRMMSEG
jgi:hypothetical protein